MLMGGEKSLNNQRKPMVLVFAGPNGSGKSTITEYFEIVGRYTNADDMVRTSFISNEEAAIKLMNSDMSLSVKKKISHLRLFCLQSTRFAYLEQQRKPDISLNVFLS
jgi:predicted ABC-type ATPase